MKALATLALTLLTTNAMAAGSGAFLCAGTYLFSNLQQRPIAVFYTESECKVAVSDAKNGFICAGRALYNAASSSALTLFPTAAACQSAVNASN